MTKQEFAEYLEDLLTPLIKFKTHKLRKAFFGDLKQKIDNVTIEQKQERYARTQVVKPNPNPTGAGFTIMTEGKSMEGDDHAQRHAAKVQSTKK